MEPFLSSSFLKGSSSFFALFYYILSFFFEIWKGGEVATPVTPPPP